MTSADDSGLPPDYHELLDHLAAQSEIRALADELREAGLMWVCEGCGGEVCSADGVCSCGVVRP